MAGLIPKLLIGGLGVAGVAGGLLFLSDQVSTESRNREPILRAQLSGPLDEPKALPRAMLEALELRTLKSPVTDPTAAVAIHQELDKTLGDDRMGQALRAALVAQRNGDPEAETLVQRTLALLESDPDRGVSTVKQALESLPEGKFPLERVGLWATAGDLVVKSTPPHQKALAELALRTLETQAPKARKSQVHARTDDELNRALSGRIEDQVPVAAHHTYLRSIGRDPEAALEGTLRALAKQGGETVRNQIANQFRREYPELDPRLMAGVRSQGATLRPAVP